MSSMSSSKVLSHQDEEIDLSMVVHQLWENKWIILIFMLVTLSLGILYASRQVPQYQSEVLLQIEQSKQSGAGISGQSAQQLIFGGGRNELEATQVALIKSPYILAPVVNSLGLDLSVAPKQSQLMRLVNPSKATLHIKAFEVDPQHINKRFYLRLEKENRYRLMDSVGHLVLQGEVGVLATNEKNTIRLFVDAAHASPNTEFSLQKSSSSGVVNSLQSRLKILDLGENRQSTGILSLRLTDANPHKAVLILNAIAKTIQAKDIRKNATEASKTLEFLQQQLPITKGDLVKSETELNRYRAKNGKIDIKIQSTELLKQLSDIDNQLSKVRIEKIDMLQRHTVEHPFIIGLNTKTNELKSERDKLERQLKKLPASDQIAVNLMRDVKVKNTLYLILLNKIQELQVVKAGIVSNVRILSLAKIPYEPLPQRKIIIYLASLMLGVMLGLFVIFARKLLYPRVNDPHWSERKFDLVNVAVIPYSKEQFLNTSLLKNKSLKEITLLAHTIPRNFSIESLRSLRTTLQVRLSCTSNNIISILGVSPGVGKTFVSANLAYLLAAAGKRVLLIDTDMRRGTLHKYFGVSSSPGLADILNDKSTLSDAIVPTVQENLMVLPRGAYPHDPSELLTGGIFKELLNTVSQQFDIVVIDTPPVLLVTDAVLIAVHAGTNYLLLGAGAHQPTEIELSLKRLTNAGVTLNGSVFNFHKQASVNQSGYGYKYGYKYSYYYDDKESAEHK